MSKITENVLQAILSNIKKGDMLTLADLYGEKCELEGTFIKTEQNPHDMDVQNIHFLDGYMGRKEFFAFDRTLPFEISYNFLAENDQYEVSIVAGGRKLTISTGD